jgi:hypothetical protein
VKTQTALAVARWLLSCNQIKAATPVLVEIAGRTYAAARYTKRRREFLYAVGTMPPLHDKMRRICYRTDDSEYAWHLIAWFRQRSACTEWSEVSPFGSHFILALWSPVETWAEEQYQRKPLRRFPMTITEIGPTDVDVEQPTKEKHDDRS